jgi:hypothetical protein
VITIPFVALKARIHYHVRIPPHLKCGEAIVVKIKMNFTNENYRLCVNRNLFVDESKKDFPKTAYFYDNDEKIFSCHYKVPFTGVLFYYRFLPNKTSKFTIELYAFPKELGFNEEQLFDKISLGEKILSIEKEVRC